MTRVLIADDSILLRSGLRKLIEEHTGWVCAEALNGRDAMTKVQQAAPDILILDLFTSVMDGLQAARAITKLVPDLPIHGLSLVPYTGPDAGELTVNGELNKLGHNVSFGHGIHAGIHWRSDTDTSLLLGEAVALSFLRNKAQTYNEPFTVHLTKFDGTPATVSNRGNS